MSEDHTLGTMANTDLTAKPLSIEDLRATVERLKSEPMVVQPDWFSHVTPCCGRLYQTTGSCAKRCPYRCGASWLQPGFCPGCQAVEAALIEAFRKTS